MTVLDSVAASRFQSPAPANETNWKSSQLFCQTLADAIRTHGNDELPNNFPALFEPYLNNVLECAISERTQLSVQACRLLTELPKVLGKDMHPLLDRILPVLVKHCSSTKTVNQKSSAAAISSIIVHSTYNSRLLWHVTQAFEEKNVGPRIYAPGWMKLILETYYKALHPDRDYDAIAQAITHGLLDADLTVRTNNRAVYWSYHKIDPAGADNIKAQLNNHAQTALENDPHNPEKKPVKSKPKKQAETDQALAELRLQGKKRMQERMQERNRIVTPQSLTSDNFAFAGPMSFETAPIKTDMNQKTSAPDGEMNPPQKQATAPTYDGAHKPTSRPIAIHKKGYSHDGQILKVGNKISSADLGSGFLKKPGSSEALKTSQTKHNSSSVADSQSSRPLLSAPVRRPRIIATPINATQPTSRPSSRTGQATTATTTATSTTTSTANSTATSTVTAPAQLETHTKPITSYPQDIKLGHELSAPAELVHPIRVAKKPSRLETTAYPMPIPDGKENASMNTSKTASVKLDRSTSPIKKPLETLQQQREQTTAHRDFTQTTTELPPDTDVSDARRALKNGLRLLQNDQMDYMGFRKLKKLICNFGYEIITEQPLYDALLIELIPRLGTIDELVYRGDPHDMKHPTYVRQAVIYMINTLLSDDFHYIWREQYLGPVLGAVILARCTLSPTALDVPKHSTAARTVELLGETCERIITVGKSPLDILNVVLDCMQAGESFLIENAEDLSVRTGTWASFKDYRMRQEAHAVANYIDAPPTRLDDPADEKPNIPNKIPYFMEIGLKVVTSLLDKAKKLELPLYPAQEEMLADLASHLLETYDILLRHQVMLYCKQLYLMFSSYDKFWQNFPKESDRNLLHYHLHDVKR